MAGSTGQSEVNPNSLLALFQGWLRLRPVTVLEAIQRSTEFLSRKGVESPRLQAELLLAHVLRLPRMRRMERSASGCGVSVHYPRSPIPSHPFTGSPRGGVNHHFRTGIEFPDEGPLVPSEIPAV